MTTERDYLVWIKGQRLSTEKLVKAARKEDAIFVFARTLGIKTFKCDGMLAKRMPSQSAA